MEPRIIEVDVNEFELVKQHAAQLRRRMLYLTGALVLALVTAGVAIFFSLQANATAHQAQLASTASAESLGLIQADLARAESRRLAAAANALLESSSGNAETAA